MSQTICYMCIYYNMVALIISQHIQKRSKPFNLIYVKIARTRDFNRAALKLTRVINNPSCTILEESCC